MSIYRPHTLCVTLCHCSGPEQWNFFCSGPEWCWSVIYLGVLRLYLNRCKSTHHGCSSSFVSIISEFSHMFGQALAQWRAFSLAVARSSRLHSFSRSGHLSRCCMVCSEVPHSQAVSAVSA